MVKSFYMNMYNIKFGVMLMERYACHIRSVICLRIHASCYVVFLLLFYWSDAHSFGTIKTLKY